MKKCPYCAEEIQDEAIVCRYCGRDLAPAAPVAPVPVPPTPAKKKSLWYLYAILGAMLLCIVVLIAANANKNNPAASKQGGSGAVAQAQSTPTPRPQLGMDLSQFVAKYDSMTDIQKKDFVGQSIGKWVDWTGEVFEVKSDGTVLVNIAGTLLSTVSLDGVSKDTAASLSKGQSVHFTGRISDVISVLGLYIYLKEVEILQ